VSEPDLDERKSGALGPLLWAVFLGVSWTWVIGMFMPVLLVRDYGAWGWVVFALPNVIGAAAMGWVLRDAAASAAFVRHHAAACFGFSLVTVAFHVFFAAWMVERVGGPGAGWGALGAAVVMVAGGFLVKLVTGPTPLRWAGAALVLALSCAMWYMLHGQGALAVPSAAPLSGRDPGLALAYVAPVFLVGFALNPYLDLTFHRARQFTSPAGGRVAFGVGFGLVFFSMIVLTFLYARFLSPAVDGRPLSRVMSIYLVIHLAAQSAFTVAAHLGEMPMRVASILAPRRAALAAVCTLLALAAVAALGLHASTPRTFRGRDLGEVVYWCFLGFYGLVFPGYVWLCAMPRSASAHTRPSPRALAVLAGVVVVAFPMYWMGFVERRHVWLIPGLLVMLLSRMLVRRATAASAAHP
jgi:hypothetical protein